MCSCSGCNEQQSADPTDDDGTIEVTACGDQQQQSEGAAAEASQISFANCNASQQQATHHADTKAEVFGMVVKGAAQDNLIRKFWFGTCKSGRCDKSPRASNFDAAVGTVQNLRRRLAATVKEPECASPKLTSPLKPQRLEPRLRALVDVSPEKWRWMQRSRRGRLAT